MSITDHMVDLAVSQYTSLLGTDGGREALVIPHIQHPGHLSVVRGAILGHSDLQYNHQAADSVY